MKRLKMILIVTVLVVFSSNQTMLAQNKTKAVKEEAQKVKVEDKVMLEDDANDEIRMEQMKRKMEEATPEERAKIEAKLSELKHQKANNGNAYGKTKGDMEGSEFGKQRAMDAQEKLKNAYQETNEVEASLEASQIKIKEAKSKLEEAKNQGMSEDDIKKREAKIMAAEKELKEARGALENSRKVIMEKHRALSDEN